jgi:type I restriction enzyme S subunit
MREIPIENICNKNPVIKWDDYNSEHFEYIDISSIDKDSKTIIGTTTIRVDQAPSRAQQPIIAGDVLVSTVRPNLNAVALVGSEIKEVIASTGFCVLRPKKNEILPEYLFHFTRTVGFVKQLVQKATGANYPAVSNSAIKSVKIPIPPLKTQKRIVELLDRAQALIDKRKEQIALMDKLIQSLFHDMFGDPVTNSMRWKIVNLGTCINQIIGGKSIGGEERDLGEGEYAVLKISAVTSGTFRCSEYKVVSKSDIPSVMLHPQKGDLLFSRANTRDLVGATCIVDAEYNQLFLPDKLWKIQLRPSCSTNIYVKNLLTHEGFRENLKKVATGTSGSMLNISKAKLLKLSIPNPPIDLQTHFSERVQQIEAQKEAMTTSLHELENNFKSLMQRAFKGEI